MTGGEVHDAKAASDLIETLSTAYYTIADKSYDSEGIRHRIRQKSSTPIIPGKTNSKTMNANSVY
ncbi:hypothetical protein LEG80045_15890 [Legionella pneumophila]|nr:hypothetical protein LEG80045_15890 [Legionella pneumophila]